jgi:hypothetical protein
MITSEFNVITGIFEVNYTGRIQLSDLLKFGIRIYEDKSLPRRLLMLTDATVAQYEISISEISELIESVKIHISPYEYVKAAYVQSRPKETAYSMLMSTSHPIKNFFHKVFSTREAAKIWLLS